MRIKMLFWLVLCIFVISGNLLAATEDIGEIAVIEDTNGTILAGMTAMMPDAFLRAVTCAFYLNHPDEYDAVIVFNTSVTNMQQGWVTKNETEGIGRTLWNWNSGHCATQDRLRSAVNMGNINTLPYDPDDIANIVPFYPLTGIELLGHEFGHQWLASVNFNKGDETQCLLRGYEENTSSTGGELCSGGEAADFNQHWSYNFNSCSLMYGSCIEEKEEGVFTYTYDNVKYSQLDQYLMGLRSKEEVDPMFVVDTGTLLGTSSIPLQHGNSKDHTGTRVDLTIDDIIRENGPRSPATDICHWKSAFILVHPAGQPPTEAQLQQVENYRVRWEEFYPYATDNRGSFDTTLKSCGTGTESCPGQKSYMCNSESCTEGELRCKSVTEVILCKDYEWITVATCPEGTGCNAGECEKTTTEDGDDDLDQIESSEIAEIDEIEIAKEDSNQCVEDSDCPSGFICVNSNCFAENDEIADGDNIEEGLCSPNDVRCVGEVFQRCNFNGSSWVSVEDCGASGNNCSNESGCESSAGCNAVGRFNVNWLILMLCISLLFSLRLLRRRALKAESP